MSDPWYPLGNGNMMMILDHGIHIAQMMSPEEIENALDLVTVNGAKTMMLDDYIHQVSKKFLSFADENHMPVFVLPWNIPLIDVFEELGHAIAYHDRLDSERADILSCILLGTIHNDEVMRYQAELAGYDFAGEQCIFVIHIENIYHYDELWLRQILEDCFDECNKSIVTTRFSQNLVGIAGAATEEYDIVETIFEKFCKTVEKNIHSLIVSSE